MGAPSGVVEQALEAGDSTGRGTVAAAAAAVTARLRLSTVGVRARRGGGSGVVWDDRTIVTNAHVARDSRVVIETADGRELAGRLTRRDERRDLATVDVPDHELFVAPVGDSDALRPGELVLAVGNPLGVPGALALGVVHTVAARPTRLGPGADRWVQAAIRLAPGNSGGPLADAHGRVVGINSMIVGGLGLAVPSRAVERFLGRLASPAPLGVTVRPAVVRAADGTGARPGLLLVGVAAAGAAAAAGLLVGDVLVGTDGRAFAHPADLGARLAEAEVGATLVLDVVRGGRLQQRAVTLAAAGGAEARAA